MRNSSDLAAQLSELVLAIQATGQALIPSENDELLGSIVEAAARIFGAAAASIALVEESSGELVFRVAYGAGSDAVVGMRIGIDSGIAGYVANTGQPLAISNVQKDPRFARSTAESTGYVPRSILAMPLLVEDRVIGVIEVLDKLQAPSFGMQDMELLGMFARQAAIAIHQSQQLAALDRVLVENLRRLVSAPAAKEIVDAVGASDSPQIADTREIARVLQTVGALGDAERRACLEILRTFADYAAHKK